MCRESLLPAPSPTRPVTPPLRVADAPAQVTSVSYKSRSEEIEMISQSLSERLRRVCAHMSDSDFATMVGKMADLQWRSEHRAVDAFTSDLLRFRRDESER